MHQLFETPLHLLLLLPHKWKSEFSPPPPGKHRLVNMRRSEIPLASSISQYCVPVGMLLFSVQSHIQSVQHICLQNVYFTFKNLVMIAFRLCPLYLVPAAAHILKSHIYKNNNNNNNNNSNKESDKRIDLRMKLSC